MINISMAELFKQLNRYFYKKEGAFLLLFVFFMTLLAYSIYNNGFLSFIKNNSIIATLIILLGGLGFSYFVIAFFSWIKKIICLACNNKKERKKLSLLFFAYAFLKF